MPDWTSSMKQTFEYYTVDTGTWKDTKKLDNVKSCTISRDSDTETLGSATIDVTESLGESYIRVYLITDQNGVVEKFPLGTFLVQTPSSSFDGKIRDVSMDAYTPLLELKESKPTIGYTLLKDAEDNNIMENAYNLVYENARAPVTKTTCSTKLTQDFVSDVNDSWLTFITDLIANAKYRFDLDEMGRILFAPKQDTQSLQPIWTYTDDNSSILLPDISIDHDLYGIPNVIEVVYSNGFLDTSDDTIKYSVIVKNEDPNSPTSIPSRGRVIPYRVIDPNISGVANSDKLMVTKDMVMEYAQQLLRDLSSIEYSVSYTHAYCPVRLGDCVRLNYTRAGLNNVKAKVISQSIKCEPGCPVTEKAVFTTKLWG